MVRLAEKYSDRINNSFSKIKSAFKHEPNAEMPKLIMDINYWVSTMAIGDIPENYFTDHSVMFDYQIKSITRHMEQIDDDYIPALFPWYGTGIIPSAMGCEVSFVEKMDPAVESKVVFTPEDVKSLKMPDPYKDGLMPRVLETIDYMVANADIPVAITDNQGPFNIALCLCGPEVLFLWMYEHPKAVHELMDFCTEALIEWIKVQKKHTEKGQDTGIFPHLIKLPEEFGGIYLCDDDCSVISAAHYKEFVVPYKARVLKAFGGGTIHFCGSAMHQLQNFLQTEGLTGINNFCMGDFKQVAKMQELFEDKIVLKVCDFTPLHIKKYYTELFSFLKSKGTIVGSYVAPELALDEGKYHIVSRDSGEMVKELKEVFNIT